MLAIASHKFSEMTWLLQEAAVIYCAEDGQNTEFVEIEKVGRLLQSIARPFLFLSVSAVLRTTDVT